MIKDDSKIFLLDKLLQAGYIMSDIKMLLDMKKMSTNKDIRDILSAPLFKLNISQVLAISKALDKSPEYIIDAARFGGKDLINMNQSDFYIWMRRLSTEHLESDVRRNLSWAISRGFDVPNMVKEYLDNHPELRFKQVKVSSYQYKLAKEMEEFFKNQSDKSCSTKDL